MNQPQQDQEIYGILGIDDRQEKTTDTVLLTPEEKSKKLRKAQNANRGHPRKGETRETLQQINVSCLSSISEQFTDLSLRTSKTKRMLMEEAILYLIRKYEE